MPQQSNNSSKKPVVPTQQSLANEPDTVQAPLQSALQDSNAAGKAAKQSLTHEKALNKGWPDVSDQSKSTNEGN